MATLTERIFAMLRFMSQTSKNCSGGWPVLIHKRFETPDNKILNVSYYYGNNVRAHTSVWLDGDVKDVCSHKWQENPPQDYELEEIFG